MPTRRRLLALEPAPRSAAVARAWVSSELRSLGHPELVENAVLGVSELVANAVLHGTPPLEVALTGGAVAPRIEVRDGSPRPARRAHHPAEEVTTFGRGLELLGYLSRAWGSEPVAGGRGKKVWFLPSAEIEEPVESSEAAPGPATGTHTDQADVPGAPGEPQAESTIVVRLLGGPVDDLLRLQVHLGELDRELKLRVLADPAADPVATELVQLYPRVPMLRLPHEIHRHSGTTDLDYRLTPEQIRVLDRVDELLDRIATRQDTDLLTLRLSPQLRRLQRWVLEEVHRQHSGAKPRAWGHHAAGPIVGPSRTRPAPIV